MTETKTLKERFDEKWIPEPNSGCWLWSSAHSPRTGYGFFWYHGRYIGAHRASFIIHGGTISDGCGVFHKCDVRSCVNPSHLWTGTARENMQDAVRKGRAVKGSRQGHSKLTEEQVLAIRASTKRRSVIAKSFNVTPETVWRIKRRKSWQHI